MPYTGKNKTIGGGTEMLNRIWTDLEIGRVKTSIEPDPNDLQLWYRYIVRRRIYDTYPGDSAALEDIVVWALESAIYIADTCDVVGREMQTLNDSVETLEATINENAVIGVSEYIETRIKIVQLRARIRDMETAYRDLHSFIAKIRAALEDHFGSKTPWLKAGDFVFKLASGTMTIQRGCQSATL